MGNKTKAYSNLIIGLVGFFMLGAYATSQFKFDEPVEIFRWCLTGGFAVIFIGMAINQFKQTK